MFLGRRFFIIFKARKNRPKIEKMLPKIEKRPPRRSQNQSLRRFGVGPAACAGPPGGEEEGGGINIMKFDEGDLIL